MPNPSRPSALSHPAFDAVDDFGKIVSLTDDFIAGDLTGDDTATGLGLLGWTVTDVAGDGDSDVEPVAGTDNHPGVIQLNTGPTSPATGDEASLFLQALDPFILPDSDEVGLYVAAVVSLPSVADVEAYFGLFDAADAAGRGVNSVCAEFDASADAEWNLVVVDGSSATAVASTVTVAASTWYKLEIVATEGEAFLYINGEYAAHTTSTDIPDSEGLTVGFKVATEADAEKSIQIDAAKIRASITR